MRTCACHPSAVEVESFQGDLQRSRFKAICTWRARSGFHRTLDEQTSFGECARNTVEAGELGVS